MVYGGDSGGPKPLRLSALGKMRAQGEPIACMTAYDASFAKRADAAGVDLVLVGDTLGMVVQGQPSTVPVTVDDMVHRFLHVHQMDKVRVAAAIARAQEKTLVFVRTKRGADRLVEQLATAHVRAAAIHGDLRQANRERALADFSSGKLPVLVATDVAARGLDIEGVDVVVHYDPPEDHKAYLHRSGRTARAGSTGVVATLVLWNQVVEAEVIQRRLGLRLPIVEVFSNDPRLADLAAWEPTFDESVL